MTAYSLHFFLGRLSRLADVIHNVCPSSAQPYGRVECILGIKDDSLVSARLGIEIKVFIVALPLCG